MRIFCIGRNYVDHVAELNNLMPEDPVVFIKPDSSLWRVTFPRAVGPVHFEGELVLRLGPDLTPDHMTVGIDFTARELQTQLKSKGLPWELSKGFDGSAVLGEWIPFTSGTVNFTLEKNGSIVQRGNTDLLIFDFKRVLSFLSQFFELKTDDVIFTGTPAGVGLSQSGDEFVGRIEGQEVLSVKIH